MIDKEIVMKIMDYRLDNKVDAPEAQEPVVCIGVFDPASKGESYDSKGEEVGTVTLTLETEKSLWENVYSKEFKLVDIINGRPVIEFIEGE